MDLEINVANTIGTEWLEIEPTRIGSVPTALSTPDAFVLSAIGGKPSRRIDVYYPLDSYAFAIKAVPWSKWIAVGYCNLISLVPLESGDVITFTIAEPSTSGDYLIDLWCEHAFMLVITGSGLTRIERDGSVGWRNHCLGIDGIILDKVSDVSIEGAGEWDPPGGWKPFQISSTTGLEMTA
ncbi:MAG: hypothetical protein ACRBCJ_13615 [Hyphomicrobiaceae bacterium]